MAARGTRRIDEGFDLPEDNRHSMGSGGGRRGIGVLIKILLGMALLLVIALLTFLVLSSTSAFTIASIDTEDTEHLDAESIAKLAAVEEGTTLLNIDESVITENLKRNPWVRSVSYVREFPDRLKIVVTERTVDCIVKMSTGSVCWTLGDDQVWIEPINLSVLDGQSADDAAIALSQRMGALLITNVPTSMSPSAGSEASDDSLKAVMYYREQFSSEFSSQIVCYSAASAESISCTLRSGVEVSLGAPTNIDLKESVIREILEQHPNQITYINVRVPSQPSYRKLGVESVTEGTGISVDTTEAPAQTQAPSQTETKDESASKEQDTSRMVLGEDGAYHTYEEYYGVSYEEYYGISEGDDQSAYADDSYYTDETDYGSSGYDDYDAHATDEYGY